MTQFYSRSDTVFNGDVYSIPFSYTEKNEINVYIDDVIFSNWLFLNDSQIQLTSIPEGVTSESVVSIRRTTDITKPIVEYSNNTMLTKEALNSSQNQLLNAVQEVYDNDEEFKTEINNTISEVNTAAKLIKTTVETVNGAVEKCTNQANSAESSANTATEKLDEIVQKADEISSSANKALATIKSDSEEQLNRIKQVGFYRKGKHLYYKDDEGNEVEFKSYSFVPGTIYQVTGKIDESENLFRYANGQVVIEDESIKGLTAFLDKQEELGNTSIFCTEEEWQLEKTQSKLGQCGKYVRDKEAGTLRLPAIINLQGLTDMANTGGIKTESLPNVTGSIDGVFMGSLNFSQTGSLKKSVRTPASNRGVNSGSETRYGNIIFDASDSSSTYQDGASVQQEAIQYPYVLCVNTGTAEEPERPINNYMVNNPFSFGVSQYYKGKMNNLSWLRSNGQKNYKAVYPDFYNWALGQLNAGVEGFKNHTDENITDYDFEINTTDESFRLPLKNGMEGMLVKQVPVIGDGHGLGLTLSPSGSLDRILGTINMNGVAYNTFYLGMLSNSEQNKSTGSNVASNLSGTGGNTIMGVTTESGKSGLVADLSNPTVPSDYNLYYYVGETVQNSNLINAARIEETLVDKVDVTNTQWAINACMPDYSAQISITLPPVGQVYTIPYDCYLYFIDDGSHGGGLLVLRLNDKNGPMVFDFGSATQSLMLSKSLIFKKGTKLYVDSQKNISDILMSPLIGAN